MPPQAASRCWRCGPGLFRQALEALRAEGGLVDGSPAEGSLRLDSPAGRLEGTYRFDGEELTITVTRRPAVVPLEAIWSRLDALCGPPVARA